MVDYIRRILVRLFGLIFTLIDRSFMNYFEVYLINIDMNVFPAVTPKAIKLKGTVLPNSNFPKGISRRR
jgi:hypothetical protein